MDMRKKIAVIAMVLLLLISIAGCKKGGDDELTEPTVAPATEPMATEKPTEEPTEEPTAAPTEPSWVPGTVRATYGGAVYKRYNLGDKVTVKGEFDGFYIIEGEELDLLIETRYLRHAGEELFEEDDGYARSGTEVFKTAYLTGEAIATLKLNTKVTVIEGKENWLHITWDGGEGYVDAEGISPYRITYRSGDSSSGGSSGGSSGPQDGTDIDLGGLSASGISGGVHLLAGYYGPVFTEMAPIEGIILTDECEAYMYLYNRGDEAKITTLGEESCEVYIDGYYATIPRWLVSVEGDEMNEAWTGYARSKAAVYSKHQMREIYLVNNLKLNTEVEVIDELPHCYVVMIDGEVGYMSLDEVMQNRYVYRGGGGGGSSSGGGGGSPYDEWTPDAL